jgi:hypothetical protein
MRIIKPTHENVVMVKDKTKTFQKDVDELDRQQIIRAIAELPEITIEPPPE